MITEPCTPSEPAKEGRTNRHRNHGTGENTKTKEGKIAWHDEIMKYTTW